jgi:hypothetical protein
MKITEEDKYALFGTGMSAFSFLRSFPEVKPLFFLDNNVDKQYSLYNNLPVLPPEILKMLDYKRFKIIIVSEFYNEISGQLQEFGLIPNEDFFNESAVYLESCDYFLISFMKCGRTWLRFMIGQLIERQFDLNHPDKLIYTDCVYFSNDQIPVIKAYHDDNPHQHSPDNLQKSKINYGNHKIIFLVRDPIDVAVSLYYHMKYRSKQYDGNIHDFVIEIIPTIVRYFNIWFDNKNLVQELLIVRYEDLHLKGMDTLRKINDFLGFDEASNSLLRSVISASNFEKMKEYERENQSGNAQLSSGKNVSLKEAKVRKGKIGGFIEELENRTIIEVNDFIRENLNPYYKYEK